MSDPRLTKGEVQDDRDAEVSPRRSRFSKFRRTTRGGQEPRHPPLTRHTLDSEGGENEDGSFQDSDLEIRLEICRLIVCSWEEIRMM